MTDEPPPEFDPAELLGAFVRHGVEFVAVGGFAALLHGAQRTTKDIDLCVRWSNDTSSASRRPYVSCTPG